MGIPMEDLNSRYSNFQPASIGAYSNNPSVTAPADAPVDFGYMAPASSYYATPIYSEPAPAPAYYPPAPAPTQNYQPSYAAAQNAPNYGYGGGGGSYGGAPAPQPQPKPVISDADWLAGDSTYQNQMGQLNTALSDFLARLNTQRADFTSDYNTALQGLQRNQDNGMLNLGEDFTARGMANSGLFAQSRDQLGQNYQNQRNATQKGYDRGVANFDTQEQDKRTSTAQGLDNAKQQSLARLAAQQMF